MDEKIILQQKFVNFLDSQRKPDEKQISYVGNLIVDSISILGYISNVDTDDEKKNVQKSLINEFYRNYTGELDDICAILITNIYNVKAANKIIEFCKDWYQDTETKTIQNISDLDDIIDWSFKTLKDVFPLSVILDIKHNFKVYEELLIVKYKIAHMHHNEFYLSNLMDECLSFFNKYLHFRDKIETNFCEDN